MSWWAEKKAQIIKDPELVEVIADTLEDHPEHFPDVDIDALREASSVKIVTNACHKCGADPEDYAGRWGTEFRNGGISLDLFGDIVIDGNNLCPECMEKTNDDFTKIGETRNSSIVAEKLSFDWGLNDQN